MSEYTDLRNRIVSRINTVSNIGRVHDRPRYGDAHDHWIVTIDGVDQIRAWEVGLDPGADTEVEDQEQAWRHRYRNWLIRGWVSLVDDPGTYDVIVELSEGIADAIDADPRLGGLCHNTQPTQIGSPAPVFLALGESEPLCWGVELRLQTLNIVTP